MRNFLVVGLALLPLVFCNHGLGASPQDSVTQSAGAGQSSDNTPAVEVNPPTAATQGQTSPVATAGSNTSEVDAADSTPVAAAGKDAAAQGYAPVVLLVVGIVSVLGMIIGLKLNAFMALIISALIVSLGVGFVDGEDAGARMAAVTQTFSN